MPLKGTNNLKKLDDSKLADERDALDVLGDILPDGNDYASVQENFCTLEAAFYDEID